MRTGARFWRNVTVIGLAHLALIVVLVRWSRETKNIATPNVVWMNGGAGDGVATNNKNVPPIEPAKPRATEVESAPEPRRTDQPEEDQPVLASVPSDIQLPIAKPSATRTPKPTPKPSPKKKESAKPTATPTPKPKPKPKTTPKPSPKKTTLAKASPKPSLKPTPAEDAQSESQSESDSDAEKKKIAREALNKSVATASPPKATAAEGSGGKGTSPGANGHGGGAGAESQFGWYGSMLHDRFYSEWVQPTSVPSSGAKTSVLVKLRIDKGGKISNFEIVRPSGVEAIDRSVEAVAKRVTQVDPLPAGLGNGDHYDVKINFELNSDQ